MYKYLYMYKSIYIIYMYKITNQNIMFPRKRSTMYLSNEHLVRLKTVMNSDVLPEKRRINSMAQLAILCRCPTCNKDRRELRRIRIHCQRVYVPIPGKVIYKDQSPCMESDPLCDIQEDIMLCIVFVLAMSENKITLC